MTYRSFFSLLCSLFFPFSPLPHSLSLILSFSFFYFYFPFTFISTVPGCTSALWPFYKTPTMYFWVELVASSSESLLIPPSTGTGCAHNIYTTSSFLFLSLELSFLTWEGWYVQGAIFRPIMPGGNKSFSPSGKILWDLQSIQNSEHEKLIKLSSDLIISWLSMYIIMLN